MSQAAAKQTTDGAPAAAVEVRYVGVRSERKDNVCGTKTVWRGEGDVQRVPADVARRLIKHADVWRLASEPWEPRPVRAVGQLGAAPPDRLADLVRAGGWEEIERIEPVSFALALRWWRNRLIPANVPEPPPVEQDPGGVEQWARNLLDGNVPEVRARLAAHESVMADAPELIEALGQTEASGRNRRTVLELIEGCEERIAAGQSALPISSSGSADS